MQAEGIGMTIFLKQGCRVETRGLWEPACGCALFTPKRGTGSLIDFILVLNPHTELIATPRDFKGQVIHT